MTDPVTLAYIGLGGIALNGIFTAINTLIANRHTRELSAVKTVVKDTKESVVTLEKNTNSIHDELIKVTGQAEFAKGLKLGAEGSGGMGGVVLDAQVKAARSEGILKGAADEQNRAKAERAAGPVDDAGKKP